MKVGFSAYAVGVLFMDSLLSIISVIPPIFSQHGFLLCHSKMLATPKPQWLAGTIPPLKSGNQLIYSVKGSDWNREWRNAWSGLIYSLIYSQSDHPLKPPQSSKPFEENTDNVLHLYWDTKYHYLVSQVVLWLWLPVAVTDDVLPLTVYLCCIFIT